MNGLIFTCPMEHPIFFPYQSKQDLADRINERLGRIKFRRYGNEPNYTPALVERLTDFGYEDENVTVTIEGAVMTSVGKGTAEKWSGADFSVVATISKNGETVKKGLVFQSKRGTIEDLRKNDKREYVRCEGQIRDMKRLCPNPKVLEIYEEDGSVPTVVSGTSILSGKDLQHLPFGDWVAKRFLPTFDGRKDPFVVDRLLDANLSGLKVKFNIKT